MRKTWLAAACTLAATMAAPLARAADHRDGSNVISSPEGDINDVYAWMSKDAGTVYLAMTVVPNAGGSGAPSRFSDSIKYVINLNSRPLTGDAVFSGAAAARDRSRTRIIATFDNGTPQRIRLWVVNQQTGQPDRTVEYLTGDPSSTDGLRSTDGLVRVFAGLRDDPFFFNQDGFNALTAYVRSVATSLPGADGAGCIPIDQQTALAAAAALSTRPGGGTAANSFGTFNALAIVVAIDKGLLAHTGPILAVWGSTHR
jgi:hypothetical protein